MQQDIASWRPAIGWTFGRSDGRSVGRSDGRSVGQAVGRDIDRMLSRPLLFYILFLHSAARPWRGVSKAVALPTPSSYVFFDWSRKVAILSSAMSRKVTALASAVSGKVTALADEVSRKEQVTLPTFSQVTRAVSVLRWLSRLSVR